MKLVRRARTENGLSLPVILLSGIIAAIFLLVAVFTVRHVLGVWSPTKKNVEALLTKGRYREALALMETKGASFHDTSDAMVEAGKIWLALAWDRMNKEGWRSYGKNERDWMDVAEASKAESYLIQALEHNPSNTDAYYYLGMLYMEKGWYSLAEEQFLEVLKVRPDDVRTRQNLGVLYTRMDRLELGKKELLHANRVDPENASVMKNLAFLYRFYLDMPESAMVWANRYMNASPEGDLDINLVREELNEMLERYPDLTPEEPLLWKKPPKFTARRKFPSSEP